MCVSLCVCQFVCLSVCVCLFVSHNGAYLNVELFHTFKNNRMKEASIGKPNIF